VDGVVIARNVDEGQTVVSSLSAQTIFLIATDLRKVQVQASIPEADIGKVRVEQPVTFTVDAYDEEFHGKVSAVRLAAVTVQNVVTYPVIIEADNPDEKLFPGMTANLTCEVARRSQALKLPNAALRFRPEEAAQAGGKPAGQEGKRGPGGRGTGPRVWVQEKAGAPPTPVPVRLGITDGTATELLEPAKLAEAQEVIMGLQDNGQSASGVVNPFTPQLPAGARRTTR
jgi:HlyD family secretion protein